MGRLSKLVLPALCLLLLGCMQAWAQEQCSLIVRVRLPDGARPEASVTVREASGRVEEKPPMSEDARFCDLGILPVTVTVGSVGLCNQVTVHDVPVSIDDTYILQVTYDPLACSERPAPSPMPYCTVLFRIADTHATWLAGAHVSLSTPRREELVGDRFGRALLLAPLGADVTGTVTATGFSEKSFTWRCPRAYQKYEQSIELTR